MRKRKDFPIGEFKSLYVDFTLYHHRTKIKELEEKHLSTIELVLSSKQY